jgi:flagellar biosynthetic protein FliR
MSPIIFNADQIGAVLSSFLWPFFRISAVFAVMPVLGGSEVPVRVRVALAFAITILVFPVLDTASMPVLPALSAEAMVVTLQQILIGVATGLMVLMVFNAVLVAGESIAVTMGLGFALMNDPVNGIQVPTVSQFYLVIATLLFLALDVHHAVLGLVVDSFVWLPVGQPLATDSMWALANWSAMVFKGALAIALPALAAMLAANLAMGVMTRSAPQLNLFSVGFPVTMTIGFFAILVTLGGFGETFGRLLEDMMPDIRAVLEP